MEKLDKLSKEISEKNNAGLKKLFESSTTGIKEAVNKLDSKSPNFDSFDQNMNSLEKTINFMQQDDKRKQGVLKKAGIDV